jgi:hypothetical protein
MAHQGLRTGALACALSLSLLLGCGDPPPVVAPTRTEPATKAEPPVPEFAESTWGKFHSERFQLTLPLPDGKRWKIDDHTQPQLIAKHAGTSSVVTVYTSFERDLVNHQACEDRARDAGLIPKELRTVESAVTVGPDAFDSRIWVAIEARADRGNGGAGKNAGLTGHIFLFGAYIRKCLFLHLATTVPTAEDEPRLSARLASARVSMVGELKIDPPRTTYESDGLRGPAPPPK